MPVVDFFLIFPYLLYVLLAVWFLYMYIKLLAERFCAESIS